MRSGITLLDNVLKQKKEKKIKKTQRKKAEELFMYVLRYLRSLQARRSHSPPQKAFSPANNAETSYVVSLDHRKNLLHTLRLLQIAVQKRPTIVSLLK